MGRIAAAAALALLINSPLADARAGSFAQDLVRTFEIVCLSDKPPEDALGDAVVAGLLQDPALKTGSWGALSVLREKTPYGWQGRKDIKEVPAFSATVLRHTQLRSSAASCWVGTLGHTDHTALIKPLLDQLRELQQPATTISPHVRRRFGREGPNASDPQWWVIGSTKSAVVLFYSTHMIGGTKLVRIEPPAE